MAKHSEAAIFAVHLIVNDLEDRSGLGDAWWGIDDDIRDEIIDKWRTAVDNAINYPPTQTVLKSGPDQ